MNFHYSSERNVQMLLALLKAYNIKRVIASPGAINIPVVASMQQDSFFKMYSCVDERSAAYMACGIADETGEPVIINCTGATASRNYMPGLTEAYYRKLPIIALTCSRDKSWIGHLFPQVTDRTSYPNDIVVDSAWIQTIKDDTDEWDVTISLNRVLNNLRKGPIHINLTDAVSHNYDILELPEIKMIPLITQKECMPQLPINGVIGIFCGEHKKWTKEETDAIDSFCKANDAVVFVDHCCKYQGEYGINYSIIGAQDGYKTDIPDFDLVIHIGEVSGAYDIFSAIKFKTKKVWRVNPDGAYRDLFHKLDSVFQMSEADFFMYYSQFYDGKPRHMLYDICLKEFKKITDSIPELPFSNIYVGKEIGRSLPSNSILYLGILNTLRTWSFSLINPQTRVYSNVGGFGIDGTLSTAIGASIAQPDTLCFAVLGDLSFFYDMNSIGNHNVGNNLRILLINNGRGIEFRHYNHQAAFMGNDADAYVAAANHWGKQSHDLVRHYAKDLGFKYITASNKQSFEEVMPEFLDPTYRDTPILFEIFTTTEDEQESLKMLRQANMITPTIPQTSLKEDLSVLIKEGIKKTIGEKGIEIIKILRK